MSKKTVVQIFELTLLAILCYSVLSFCISKYLLFVKEYKVESCHLNDNIRAVQISDIHSVSFGKENAFLINKIEQCNPDIILITGDLINQYIQDIEAELFLLKNLCKIAPVYMSVGNHELGYGNNFNTSVCDSLAETGAIVLNGDFVDIIVNGQNIRIGRKYLAFDPDRACWTEEWRRIEADETDLLNDILSGGTFGTKTLSRTHSSNITLNAVTDFSRGEAVKNSVIKTVFPPVNKMTGRYQYLKEHPYLLPAAWIDRIVKYGIETSAGKKENKASESIRIGNERIELLKKYGIIK